VIYASVFLTELWPEENPWRRGLEEGAHEALEERARIRELKAAHHHAPAKAKKVSRNKKPKASKAVRARAASFEAAAATA
jgi:hypothetical protein